MLPTRFSPIQEKLLKPLGGFAGLTGEWRDLAAVISRVCAFSLYLFSCKTIRVSVSYQGILSTGYLSS